ncbi:MAG: ATP synthase F0 subunit B [Lachnospiraceae bacterium]|nr:ATP synthase F0 subunit B [Lachnospiraceae bacterium]
MLEIGWNLLFTVINLVILFVAMKIFLFKPVRNIIAKRQEEADAAKNEAETMAAEAKQTKAEYEKALARTKEEREEVLATARRLADDEAEKILADAREEAKEIREAAEDEGERRKERIIAEAGKEIADMVAGATAKAMGDSDDSALYDAFLDKVEEEA